MQIAWNLHLLGVTLAVALVLVPQPAPCQMQQPKQWDPMVNPMCPRLAECGRGQSLMSGAGGGQCCPSCNSYSADCAPICVRQNFSSSPCWSSCGQAGCKRGRCGEPIDGGAQCCNVSLVKGCTNARNIYLNGDCCPVCWTNATASQPMSPLQCRFNATRGVGQPMCDSLGNCRLAAVGDRRDDPLVDFSLINLVCSQADLAPLMLLGRLDESFNVFTMGMGDGSGGGGGMGNFSMGSMGNFSMGNFSMGNMGNFSMGSMGNFSMGNFSMGSMGNFSMGSMGSMGNFSMGNFSMGNFSMGNHSMMSGGGGMGGTVFNATAMALHRDRIVSFIRNLTMMPAAAQKIASLTCRQPMVCITTVLRQLAPILNEIARPLVEFITITINSGSTPSVVPDFEGTMKNLSMRLQQMSTDAANCMSLVQSQSPCVLRAQNINFDELVRTSRCNMSSPSDFQVLQRLAAKVAGDAANNQPPGLGTLATISNCSDVRSPCVVDFINNLIDRTASGCVDVNLLRAARDRMRRLLMDCAGGLHNLTQADLTNALVNCQLTAADITQIAAAAPTKLQTVLQDSTMVAIGGAPSAGQSLGALVQNKVMSNCPDVKSSIDRALAQFLDITRLSASDVKQMVNVIKPDQMGRVDPAQWLSLTRQDLAEISNRLTTDPNRDSKCAEIVRLCNQTLLDSLTACIDKFPPEKLRSAFGSSPEQQQQLAQSFNVSKMAPRDVSESKSGPRTTRVMIRYNSSSPWSGLRR